MSCGVRAQTLGGALPTSDRIVDRAKVVHLVFQGEKLVGMLTAYDFDEVNRCCFISAHFLPEGRWAGLRRGLKVFLPLLRSNLRVRNVYASVESSALRQDGIAFQRWFAFQGSLELSEAGRSEAVVNTYRLDLDGALRVLTGAWSKCMVPHGV